MEKEKVLQSLAELEKHLQGVKNATEQVNTVVSASTNVVSAANKFVEQSTELIKQIKEIAESGYVEVKDTALKAISQSVQEVLNTKTQCIQEFGTYMNEEKVLLSEHLQQLEEKMDNAFSSAINALNNAVKGINDSNESLKTVVASVLAPTVHELKDLTDNKLSKLPEDITKILESSAKQQKERDLLLRKDIKSLKTQNFILAFCLAAMIALEFLIKFVR